MKRIFVILCWWFINSWGFIYLIFFHFSIYLAFCIVYCSYLTLFLILFFYDFCLFQAAFVTWPSYCFLNIHWRTNRTFLYCKSSRVFYFKKELNRFFISDNSERCSLSLLLLLHWSSHYHIWWQVLQSLVQLTRKHTLYFVS